ncbi:MAG: MBL fold metallo-hydrolase [Comamonadaceae bacterium]|nr:MAG: MBL fold metallo-hydrolase [Comamonadaceae bacterium]
MNLPVHFIGTCLLAAAGLLGAGCAVSQSGCDSRAGASKQATGDCHFQNAPNPNAKAGNNFWTNMSRFLFATKSGTVPIDPIPVRKLDRAALDALDNAANHIIRLGHSSHLLKLRGKYWLIDPVFSERASPVQWAGPKRFHPTPLPLPELPPIEGLVLSHDHYDHLDTATIEFLNGKVQRYFVPLGVRKRLVGMGVEAARIEEFDWWQAGRFGDVGITATPAQHFSGRTLWDRNETLWASWILQSGTERIFYSGDSGYFGGFKEIGDRMGGFDIALMENGAYDPGWPSVHMQPEETVQAFRDLRAKVLYLVHNSTFDLAFHTWRDPLERATGIAMQQGITVATPEIGEVLTLGKPRANVQWWKDLR